MTTQPHLIVVLTEAEKRDQLIREALQSPPVSAFPDFIAAVGAALDDLDRFRSERSFIVGCNECFDAAIDQAARLIEEYSIMDTSGGKELSPRIDGNREGLHYAISIRALVAGNKAPAPTATSKAMADTRANERLAFAALRLVVSYDDLLRRYAGPLDILGSGDNAAIDEAYDHMVIAARTTLEVVGPSSIAPAPLKRIAEIALGAAEAELEWTDAVDIIASSLNAAQASMTPMLNAAQALRKIVEGIEGTMNHGTWRDDHGRRLKDAPEWVDLYNAVCDAQKVVVRKNQASGKSEALLQSIADKISAHKPSPAATDEYTSGYGDGRYDAWLVVKEAADNSIAPDLRDADGYKHILRASDDIMTVVVDDKEEHPFGDDLEAGDSVESIPLFRDSTKR